jgi:ABC-2 type transport system permease protein
VSNDKTSNDKASSDKGNAASVSVSEGRRFSGRANVVLSSLLLVAIALMANYLAFRHYRRWDWTSVGSFTLSDRTTTVLRELTGDVEIYLVMSSAEGNYNDLRELLERYRGVSQHVVLNFVDPDREPSEYQLVRDRFHLGNAMLASGAVGSDVAVILVAGDRQWEITRDDLVTFDFDAYAEDGETVVDVRSEQALTGGILEVTSGRETKVCLTTGHGEWSLDGGGERSLTGLQNEMRRENLALEVIETRGRTELPEDCDVIYVVGPEQSFSAEEAALFRAHLHRGGNLFVAADPVLENGEIVPTGLEEMLREMGVRLDRTVVLELDSARLPPSSPDPIGPFIVQDYGDHPVTEAFGATGIPMVVSLVRSVRLSEEDRGTVLLRTSETSFAETDIPGLVESGEPHRDDADISGPVPIAVAIEIERTEHAGLGRIEVQMQTEDAADGDGPSEGGAAEDGAAEDDAVEDARGRLIVIGDSNFLASGFVSSTELVNYEVASAMLGWLTQRQALIAIPPRRMNAVPLNLTEDDVGFIAFRTVVLIPLAAIFLGIAVWWNRRS